LPTLPSRDLDETFVFYRRLGFEPGGGSSAENELSLARGGVELRFTLVPGLNPFLNEATISVEVPYPDQLHSEWEVAGVELDRSTGSRLLGPVDNGDGAREFSLVDRSGNVIRFAAPPAE
jgi:catechol 2,3-dioxygenase-like lactoylglutathione lyase family enzyme